MPPRWLLKAVSEIRSDARRERVRFTAKAQDEISSLRLSLDDAIDVLLRLEAGDFRTRIASRESGEWMYVFGTDLVGLPLYIKIVLGRSCRVVSFHEDAEGEDTDDDG